MQRSKLTKNKPKAAKMDQMTREYNGLARLLPRMMPPQIAEMKLPMNPQPTANPSALPAIPTKASSAGAKSRTKKSGQLILDRERLVGGLSGGGMISLVFIERNTARKAGR